MSSISFNPNMPTRLASSQSDPPHNEQGDVTAPPHNEQGDVTTPPPHNEQGDLGASAVRHGRRDWIG